MQATNFVLYCLGISTILVALAGAIRLVAGCRPPRPKADDVVFNPRREQQPDMVADGLVNRLQAFQQARYASPIVRKRLDPDEGPPRRMIGIPPRRATESPEEGYQVAPSPALKKPQIEDTDNIIPISLDVKINTKKGD